MSEQITVKRGSSQWVAARLPASRGSEWRHTAACAELLDWLYTVARRRAAAMHLTRDEQRDVVQDAMTPIMQAIDPATGCLRDAINPAAVLERVAARAVGEARHRVRMAGLGGVPANGQNWRARYPRRIGGEAAKQLLEQLPTPSFDMVSAVDAAADQVTTWTEANLGVSLTPPCRDAVSYVLDRLVAGVSRSALARGANSSLRRDPALQHLGFTPSAVSAFAVWLLGRTDAQHNSPSVLDTALGISHSHSDVERWRRVALGLGFATADAHAGTAEALRSA